MCRDGLEASKRRLTPQELERQIIGVKCGWFGGARAHAAVVVDVDNLVLGAVVTTSRPSDVTSREACDLAARNNAKLAEALRSEPDRAAFYYCVLVLTQDAGDPTPVIADGMWHGEIVLEPRGTNGFGYDPYFLTVFGKTAAELPAEAKNRVSHRARALASLAAKLRGPIDPSPRP